MLYLSGMRGDALASLPVACVDLERQVIAQLPERGVRTKNRKAALTYLLQIPELLAVVQAWQARVCQLPAMALWYATCARDGMTLTTTTRAFVGRHNLIARDIRLICAKAGVPYLSPHKLRHGHTVYALKRAHNMAQLKAISQNIMHESVVTTDQIYGRLINDDVQEIIAGL
jgi:integrase